MSNIGEKEMTFRMLAGNLGARRIAERFLQLEDEEEARKVRGESQYPWLGAEWFDVPAQAAVLNQLVVAGLLVTGGPRGTYRSRSSTTYKLKDPGIVRECLQHLEEVSKGVEQAEIPEDLFDFILGHDEVKNLFPQVNPCGEAGARTSGWSSRYR